MRLLDNQYLGYFLGALKLEIHLRLKTLNPFSCLLSIKMVCNVEIKTCGSLNHKVGGLKKDLKDMILYMV